MKMSVSVPDDLWFLMKVLNEDATNSQIVQRGLRQLLRAKLAETHDSKLQAAAMRLLERVIDREME